MLKENSKEMSESQLNVVLEKQQMENPLYLQVFIEVSEDKNKYPFIQL